MIAIDVVLLPPEEIMDLCIELNQKFKSYKELGKEDFIPHISLGMACIEDIDKVKKAFESIEFKPLELELTEIKYYEGEEGNKSTFSVKKTKELQGLHEKIMNTLTPLIAGKVSEEMIIGDELSDISKFVVDNYSKEFSYENYWPHITLCCCNAEYKGFPVRFKVDTIALCQLGNGCTCRKIIKKIKS